MTTFARTAAVAAVTVTVFARTAAVAIAAVGTVVTVAGRTRARAVVTTMVVPVLAVLLGLLAFLVGLGGVGSGNVWDGHRLGWVDQLVNALINRTSKPLIQGPSFSDVCFQSLLLQLIGVDVGLSITSPEHGVAATFIATHSW